MSHFTEDETFDDIWEDKTAYLVPRLVEMPMRGESMGRETAALEVKEGDEEQNRREDRLEIHEDVSLADLFALEEPMLEAEESEEELELRSSDSDDEGDEGEEHNGAELSSSHSSPSNGFATHRIRSLLRFEGSSTILSKAAVSTVSEAVGLMLQDLTRSAVDITSRRQHKRVTAAEVSQAVRLFDRFSFLSEVIPPPTLHQSGLGAAAARREPKLDALPEKPPSAKRKAKSQSKAPSANSRAPESGYHQTTLRF